MLRRRSLQVLLVLAALVGVPSASFAGVLNADLSITKTPDVMTATPGGSIDYTIVVSNAGPADVTGATVTDTLPASLTCTWTCTASAGSSCTAVGAGDINDSVDILNGGSVTYDVPCSIDINATGSLVNSASVASAIDPNGGNDSSTATTALAQPPVVAVPTTSQAGLALMGLLLLGAAFWTLRR
jgi:uncharacterized repeat protein (TIGR01451 family)